MNSIYFCDPGLQINDIEPFCQDEIVLYQQCVEKRVSCVNPSEAVAWFLSLFNQSCAIFCLILQDKEIRERLQDSEYKLGVSMPLEAAKERVTQLQSELTLLERWP
jgi:hypothetical protein